MTRRLKGFKIKTLTPKGEAALRIHLVEEGSLSWAKRKILRKFFFKEHHDDGVSYLFSKVLELSININTNMLSQGNEYKAKIDEAMRENGATDKDYLIEEVWR